MTKQLVRRSATVDGIRLFDEQPLTLHGFVFKARAVEPIGRPSLEEFSAAWQFATSVEEASSYWVGDLMAYSESREDFREKLDQVISVTGLAEQTIVNRAYVSRHVEPEMRNLAPSPAHAACVAAMDPAHQQLWLEKALEEGWTVSEFRAEIRAASRRKVVEGQATLRGMYRVLYADPPWDYRNKAGINSDGEIADLDEQYPQMSIEQLCKLPVQAHATKDAVLFMWVTTPMLYPRPGELGPADVLAAWGFTYKSMQTWDKVLGMPGRFFQVTTEHLIVAERGSCPPDNPTPKPKSCFVEKRSNEHSKKPSVTRSMIRKLYSKGPYVELFAREKTSGWDVLGNDPRLWE